MTDFIATYRLQFHPAFGFAEAAAVVPYLAALGISHIYASPVFRARPGSPHGYDGVDPNRLNSELGSAADWDRLLDRCRAAGIGWLQDIVPNHMAYHADNGLLADIFEHGSASRFRDFFDIDWHHPSKDLQGRVMAPFLGHRYGECLRNGDIRIVFEGGGFAARVYENLRFPLAVETYRQVLDGGPQPVEALPATGDSDLPRLAEAIETLEGLDRWADVDERCRQVRIAKETLWAHHQSNADVRRHIEACLARLNGEDGNPEHLQNLDHLLGRQRFRLCWWKKANQEINYRRFFDINELIALRQEDPAVFAHTHDLIAALAAAGRLDGVRIDHVDGLANPQGYLQALRRRLGEGVVILVEKILAPEEALPSAWPIQGTTGYDFGHWLNALFVQRDNEAHLTDIYQTYTGRRSSFEEEVRRAKREILGSRLAGDLANLVRRVKAGAGEHGIENGPRAPQIAEALMEILVRFPVYRTYLGTGQMRTSDRRTVTAATDQAAARHPRLGAVIHFIRSLLLNEGDEAPVATCGPPPRRIAAVRAFQQLSSALMAKGCEDTAFYRYHRLTALNEVGGEAGRFGCRREQFHDFILRRAAAWPQAMNSTATHDSKRGEDVRARLNVLSEIPREWRRRVHRWHDLTRNFRTRVGNAPAPGRNTVYLIFQTLVGAWPPEGEHDETFAERIQAYMRKAVREAGEATSWIDPREDYEAALRRYLATLLDPSPDNVFRADFLPFARRIAFYGRFNTLSQCLIKIAAPGLPDLYQGTELPQLALVDPDNRRPVAYTDRAHLLKIINGHQKAPWSLAGELVATAADGRSKLFLIARALDARRRYRGLFGGGRYLPLDTSGAFGTNLVAFAREAEGRWALAVAPRFLTALVREGQAPLGKGVWQDTAVHLPPEAPANWSDVFTGQRCRSEGRIAVGEALSHFPVALLISEETS
jgi:(1->4)-alpha-D-glucan 1-alpha-D-glucosylmutase